MRISNPIDKRLDFVRKQYGQETYEKTREIVAANLGIAEADIHPGQRVDWEKFIPWLGKQVHRLLKKGPRAAPELKRLERGFLASVQPFMVKKKGRRTDIARLSPKQARQFAGRQQRALGEARGEQAKKLGYKEVARLGGGYTAVQAIVDPQAPEPPMRFHELAKMERRPNTKLEEWTEKYASFQHWLGVELGNCLQIYKVNYEPHGLTQWDTQKLGVGKLYGILKPNGKPAAAIITAADGTIWETNGPGNRPPAEKDQEYVDKFIEKHLKQPISDVAFRAPDGFPPALTAAILTILDEWPYDDNRGRRRFLRKVTGYSRQQGAGFSNVWNQMVIWILIDAPYAVIKTLTKKYQDYTKVQQYIRNAAGLYRRNASVREFSKLIDVGERLKAATQDIIDSEVPSQTFISERSLRAQDDPEYLREILRRQAQGLQLASETPRGKIAQTTLNAINTTLFALEATQEDPHADYLANVDFFIIGALKDHGLNIPNKLQELMRDAARAAGGAQPRGSRRGNPTTARALIKECQRLWESYCERPNKTRLRAVVKHCEAMKASKAATVGAERKRCMRSVQAEARQHKWSL
jgi:hypothetical protein